MGGKFKRGGLLRRFANDCSGNFAVLTGAAITMLAMAVGFGVNVAQIYNVRSNLIAVARLGADLGRARYLDWGDQGGRRPHR